MDFGSMMSGLAINAGQTQIAGAEQQQRQATADNTRAEAQMRQMQALSMKQDVEDRQALAAEAQGEEQRFAGTAKTEKDSLDHFNKLAEIAVNRHQFTSATAYENLAKNKESSIKTMLEGQMKDKLDKSNVLGASALDYVANPSEATYQAMRDAALRAGKLQEAIPQYGDPKLMGAAQGWTSEGPANEARVKHLDEVKRVEREDKQKSDYQKEQQVIERERIAATLRAREEGIAAQNTRAAENRIARERLQLDREKFQAEKAAVGGPKGVYQKTHPAPIETALQNIVAAVGEASNSIDQIMDMPKTATSSLFSDLAKGTVPEALIRGGTQKLTSEEEKVYNMFGAGLSTDIVRAVTIGAGRAGGQQLADEYKRVLMVEKTDSPQMAALKAAYTMQIGRNRLKYLTTSDDPSFQPIQAELKGKLDAFVTPKQLLEAYRKDPVLAKKFGAGVEKLGETMAKVSAAAAEGDKRALAGQTSITPTAPYQDGDKESRYQAWKKQHANN